uniref:2'-phosphotransferase n=1 Tax=Oryzias sinensis TaxID=183150 RepID=A0A8C7ZL48_9TELE
MILFDTLIIKLCDINKLFFYHMYVELKSYYKLFTHTKVFWDFTRSQKLSMLHIHKRKSALIFPYFIPADGFLFVEDLLAHPQFCSYTVEDVERVVATNDKQRFKLRSHPENGRLQIRANQGHSIQVADLELIPVLAGSAACPDEAVHGTYLRNWPSIQQHGLSRMNRTHIHLAPGLPGEDGIISDGIEFFRSENGVFLTAGNAEGKLLPKYFVRALRLRPTRSVLPLL